MANQTAMPNRKAGDILEALELVRSQLNHCTDSKDRMGLDEEEELLMRELSLVSS